MSVGLLCFSSSSVSLILAVVDTLPPYPGAPAVKQWKFWMQRGSSKISDCTY